MRAMDIICSQCKERIPEGSLSCRYCGTVVTKTGGTLPLAAAAEADSAKKRSLAGKLWIPAVIILVLAVVLVLVLR
ncbi:hypothetical protein DQG13_17480 [Paenibacillus sp. YN15]|nr:hypothetical protein DQG13_17480 [Paenibacillus sp. YN15]